MKLNIIDNDITRVKKMESVFGPHITYINGNLLDWLKYHDVRAFITMSSANGMLIGDYSKDLDSIFNGRLASKIETCIEKHYNGIQPLGSSFITKIPNSDKYVINSAIKKDNSKLELCDHIYQCSKTALLCAYANDMESVLMPIMANTLKGINTTQCANLMYQGYSEVLGTSKEEVENIDDYEIKKLIKSK